MQFEIKGQLDCAEDNLAAENWNELEWETVESVCPICGNVMFLVNGFHRCRACGYKESCCYL